MSRQNLESEREEKAEREKRCHSRNRLARVFFSLLNERDFKTFSEKGEKRKKKKAAKANKQTHTNRKSLPGATPVFRQRCGAATTASFHFGTGRAPSLPAALGTVGFEPKTNEAISGDDVEE